MKTFKLYFLWLVKVAISLSFLFASSAKLTHHDSVINMFQDWGYFDNFYFIIGILEFVLAILLLIPKTATYSAIALLIVMIGAMITHIINDPIMEVIRPLTFMLFLSTTIYLQIENKAVKVDRS